MTTRTQERRAARTWGALTGVVSVLAGLGLAEFAAALLDPRSSPVAVVGAVVIDLSPPAAKDAVIALAGTGDKIVLVVCVLVATMLLSGLAGIPLRRTAAPLVLWSAVVGAIAVVIAIARIGPVAIELVPGLVLALAAIGTALLLRRVGRQQVADGVGSAVAMGGAERRRLLAAIGAAAGVGVLGAASAAVVRPSAPTRSITLPEPGDSLPDLPAGLDVQGITPLRTPASDLYRIDTALVVPGYRADTWELRIDGMVEAPYRLSLDELLAEEMVQLDATMACVSNPVGGDLVGSVRFQGVRVAELLRRSRPRSGADQVLSTSVDGFTAGTPLDVLMEKDRDALIVVGIDGEPLSPVHGAPARLFTPGLYGYVGATKWLRSLTVGTFAHQQAYWTTRGWSERGPVKTAARIDTPTGRSRVRPGSDGTVPIAGVAWAVHRGVSAVQISLDGGPWQEAELSPAVNTDYWRQWLLRVPLEPGRHHVRARAADDSGSWQEETPAAPAPNGAQGYHEVDVTVGG